MKKRSKSKSKFKIDIEDSSRELFKTVQVVVKEASETFNIWKEWHNMVEFASSKAPRRSGIMVKYGEFSKDRPCWVTMWVEMVGGYQTVFVDACGAYQDYFKLDDALTELFPNASFHTNATNFHNHPSWNASTKEQRKEGYVREAEALEKEASELRRYASELT